MVRMLRKTVDELRIVEIVSSSDDQRVAARNHHQRQAGVKRVFLIFDAPEMPRHFIGLNKGPSMHAFTAACSGAARRSFCTGLAGAGCRGSAYGVRRGNP